MAAGAEEKQLSVSVLQNQVVFSLDGVILSLAVDPMGSSPTTASSYPRSSQAPVFQPQPPS